MKIAVASNVCSASIDDIVIILDFNSDSYFCLDKEGSRIWRATVEENGSFPRAVTPATSGVKKFIDHCLEIGLWVSGAPDTVEVKSRRPCRLGGGLTLAIWCNICVRWSLTRKQLLQTYSDCRRIEARAGVMQQPEAELEKALRKFRMSENFFAFAEARGDCLSRSLALFRYLRVLGFDVSHHIGVRLYPFHAHAWAEVNDRVLLDSPALCRNYTRIASMPT